MSPLQLDGPFDLAAFLEGHTTAWGIFEDRFGVLKRRFAIEIDGQWRDGLLVVEEHFTYDDGEREVRVWRIARGVAGQFTATSDDCVGLATGLTESDVASLSYTFRMRLKARTLTVTFADRFYRMDAARMFNRAVVRKWGVTLGVATIFFQKQQPSSSVSA